MPHPKDSPVNSKALIALSQKDKKFADATKLIIKLYKGRRRPFTGIRFDSHPLTVASLLLEQGYAGDDLMVAILADVLHASTLKESTLRSLVGDAIADRVVALTPPAEAMSAAEAEAYLARLAAQDAATQSIKIAALLDHVSATPLKNRGEDPSFQAFASMAHDRLVAANAELRNRLGLALAAA